MFIKKFRVVKNIEVIPGHRVMGLEAPELAMASAPGQFLHVRCSESLDPLLRRPISVYSADREKGIVYMLYRIAGRGTELLSRVKKGELVDVIGPLGRGYTIPQKGEGVAVLGGGIGIAPLCFLLAEIGKLHDRESVSVFFGASTYTAIPALDQVRAMGFAVHTATDDGSGGFKGNVLQLAEEVLGGRYPDRVYACGPLPMLKGLARWLGDHPAAEVSMEEHMACGVGACLSCICRLRTDGEEPRYAHVCKDGPVFMLNELELSD